MKRWLVGSMTVVTIAGCAMERPHESDVQAASTSAADTVISEGGALGDFDGDGQTDMLWRNRKTGDVLVWLMQGASVRTAQTVWKNVGNEWRIVGVGDFDGDSRADILWRKPSDGSVAVWFMNGGTVGPMVYLPTNDTRLEIAGVGDFDGDRHADILWRNVQTGDCYDWLMNGSVIKASNYLGPAATNLRIDGVGDFDGNGTSDVLWRAVDSGVVGYWAMNATVTAWHELSSSAPADWSIKGVADFTGDRRADILWQHQGDGAVSIWGVSGPSVYRTDLIASSVTSEWMLGGAGDTDGDGRADIFWRSNVSGNVGLWLLDGWAIRSMNTVYPGLPLDWQFESPRLSDFGFGIGGIHAKWMSIGGVRSFLGKPTSDAFAFRGGWLAYFENGVIFLADADHAYAMESHVFDGWMTTFSYTGAPYDDSFPVAEGWYESMTVGEGAILYHPSVGTRVVRGGIRERYDRDGGPGGYLGWPVDESHASGSDGYQRFQKGTICWYHNTSWLSNNEHTEVVGTASSCPGMDGPFCAMRTFQFCDMAGNTVNGNGCGPETARDDAYTRAKGGGIRHGGPCTDVCPGDVVYGAWECCYSDPNRHAYFGWGCSLADAQKAAKVDDSCGESEWVDGQICN